MFDRFKKRRAEKSARFTEIVNMPFDNETDNAKAALFFDALEDRLLLSYRDKRAIEYDFLNAVKYYISQGVSADVIFDRLDQKNLGSFYSTEPHTWYSLDNAAKVYPISLKYDYMALFRLSVYLKEEIVPEILQMALTFTMKRYPGFATTVKKGFFWHYLDSTKRRYVAEAETGLLCQPIRVGLSGSQSFHLFYYKNRVSTEFFHSLTDGTGALNFLKTLITEYYRLLGVCSGQLDGVLDANGMVMPAELKNQFLEIPSVGASSGFVDKSALQYGGKLARVRPCRILHFKMDAAKLKEVAESKGGTVSAYILALMFLAGRKATEDTAGDFSIQVPVNMRKYYPSDTLRNFCMYCGIRLNVDQITDIDSMIPVISRQLAEKGSKRSMDEMINATNKLIATMRYTPLFIKAPVVRLIYGFIGDKIFSNTLSNIGVVKFPPEIAAHIDSMDSMPGSTITNRASCSVVTCSGIATFSISKNTADPSFEEAIYDLLVNDGIEPVVEGSELIAD